MMKPRCASPLPASIRTRGSVAARSSLRAVSARRNQRGAAIITAILVTTLAAVVVSSLFYRESVAVRSIENRLALSQTRWIERAVLDWSKVILRSDLDAVDHASDVWGTPVVETQLDETVTAGAQIGDKARDAFLAGAVSDAQARFNLNTLVGVNGAPAPLPMQALTKLMQLLSLPEGLVSQVVARLLRSRPVKLDGQVIPAAEARMITVDDLRDLPGFDEAVIQKLLPHVIVLPGETTTVNLNTASAEVIAAMIPDLALAAARSFVTQRERRPVTSLADAKSQMGLGEASALNPQLLSVNTHFFLVEGVIRYDRVESRTQTLLQRVSTGRNGKVQVIWQHRN